MSASTEGFNTTIRAMESDGSEQKSSPTLTIFSWSVQPDGSDREFNYELLPDLQGCTDPKSKLNLLTNLRGWETSLEAWQKRYKKDYNSNDGTRGQYKPGQWDDKVKELVGICDGATVELVHIKQPLTAPQRSEMSSKKHSLRNPIDTTSGSASFSSRRDDHSHRRH